MGVEALEAEPHVPNGFGNEVKHVNILIAINPAACPCLGLSGLIFKAFFIV